MKARVKIAHFDSSGLHRVGEVVVLTEGNKGFDEAISEEKAVKVETKRAEDYTAPEVPEVKKAKKKKEA